MNTSPRFQGDEAPSLIDIRRRNDPYYQTTTFELFFGGDRLAELICYIKNDKLDILIDDFLLDTQKSTKEALKRVLKPRTLSGYTMQKISEIIQQLLKEFKKEKAEVRLLDGWEQQGLDLDAHNFTGEELITFLVNGALLIVDGNNMDSFIDSYWLLVDEQENGKFTLKILQYEDLDEFPNLANALDKLLQQSNTKMTIKFDPAVINSRVLETNPLIRRVFETIQKKKHNLGGKTGLDNGYYGMWGFKQGSRDAYRTLEVTRNSPMAILNATMKG